MNKRIFLYITGLLILLFLTGCDEEEEVGDPLFNIEAVSENLGSTAKDVYFIFTNAGTTDEATTFPSISSITAPKNLTEPDSDAMYLDDGYLYNSESAESGIKKKIRDFQDAYSAIGSSSRALSPPSYAFVEYTDTEGVTRNFYQDSIDTGGTIAATCRSVETIGGITLAIWVADDCWDDAGGTKTNLIDQVMVNDMALKFLDSGVNNDIYDWVSGIYGAHWGAEAVYSNILPASEADKITILLYDIDNDNSTNGGMVGYFWGKDNFLTETYSGSNQRIMFYMDAVMYATPEGVLWDNTDFWPETIFSVLGHEFQHMIHFYQKQIVNNVSETDTWLNEMCSMVTEDLIADNLGVPGPRGIAGNYSVPQDSIYNGRLPLFNVTNDDSLTLWDGSLTDYSIVYGFGSFLARNYGGAEFFRKIVQNPQTDEQAILTALSSLGYTRTFEQLLVEWGETILMSDLSETGYNKTVTTVLDGINYVLYPINLTNYAYDLDSWTLKDPKIYNGTVSNLMPDFLPQPASNIYYQAGHNLTGIQRWMVEVPLGITLTVVTKDS